MRRLAAPLALAALLSFPATAQEAEEEGKGLSLMQRGIELFFRGMVDEMEPALRELGALVEDLGPELRDFVAEMGPALRELLAEVEDWSAYHPPERLPNGDIIIRRKSPDEMTPAPEPGEEVEI